MAAIDYIYRVIFKQDDKRCQLYAQYICEESLMGFLEVESLVFSSDNSSLIVDVQQEELKQQYKGVKRTYIPMHTVIRVDEIKASECQLITNALSDGNITYLDPAVKKDLSHQETGHDL